MSKRAHYSIFGSASSVRPLIFGSCSDFAVLYAFTHYNGCNGRFLMSLLHLSRNLRFQWGPFSGKFWHRFCIVHWVRFLFRYWDQNDWNQFFIKIWYIFCIVQRVQFSDIKIKIIEINSLLKFEPLLGNWCFVTKAQFYSVVYWRL